MPRTKAKPATRAKPAARSRTRIFKPAKFLVGMFLPNGDLQVFARPTYYDDYGDAHDYAMLKTKEHAKVFVVLGVFAKSEPIREIVHAKVTEYL